MEFAQWFQTLLTFAGVRLIPGVLQLTFPFGNSPVSCGSSGALGKGPRWQNHLTRAQRQRARHWASPARGPLHVCSGGPGLIQPLASAAQARKNPTSTAAYFPGHHLRHAATDIPNREPAVASAFWLTRKLPSAASAAGLTGCLPR